LPLWWIFVWVRSGIVDGWFVVQRVGWNTRFDFGASTLKFITGHGGVGNVVMATGVAITLAAYVGACGYVIRRGAPAPLLVVVLAGVVLTLGSSNFWYSKPRLLLCALPLVVLLARLLVRARAVVVVPLITAGVGVSAWWGAYALTRWPFAI
jgi:hypothetical protein